MISIILCGGVGSRLWPLSRELYPKPFIRLSDGQTFMQKTFIRAASVAETDGLYVMANRELAFKLAQECTLSGIGLQPSFILEPVGRNTAAAIAATALTAAREKGPETPLLVLPSDHLIENEAAYQRMIAKGLELAGQDRLTVFGVRPSRPETGFGYIEAEGEKVLRFVEKPPLEKAREYLASDRFFWNSGLFCFKAGVMLRELEQWAPEVLRAVSACLSVSGPGREGRLELDEESFSKVPSISIDYAVFEKSDLVSMVSGDDIGWSDVGTWRELGGLRPADGAGNRVSKPEKAMLEDVSNCFIDNYSRLVAALGVENLMIIDTEDALLVADQSRAQDVRLIYERLKKENREEALRHHTVFKPWGHYILLQEGPRFKTKLLSLNPGARISLQRHYHRSEHWIVVSGMAEVTCGEEVFLVNPNESTYIKAGDWHRVANPGQLDLVLIEVQSGDYLGEDDLVRRDDAYGRPEKEMV